MAAVAQGRSGNDEALVRAVAGACLQEGLSKKGSMYILKPVQCQVLGELIKDQRLSFPGRLAQHLEKPACS